ncbi:MAG: crossover junction endodeoxyribonuclease RuvC [Paludibacteraceae bacterium]|nr:crossover junction endodeoxyribonuclease RuvC [Paludibacteraceae bacterium]
MKEPEPIYFPEEYKVLGADLSLKRPGFCLLTVEQKKNGAEITDVELVSVDNKTDKKKTHGELLNDILDCFYKLVPPFNNFFLVRENEIMKVKVPSERSLSKVVGLMDWAAYRLHPPVEWNSIYPVTIKKLIAGSGKAEKSEVAEALERYIGKQEYKCDDESDAAAVAIAWLIQQGQIESKENADG